MRNMVEQILYRSGINGLFYAYGKRRITIVNYHDPVPDVFLDHLRLIARYYNFISIKQLCDAIGEQDFSSLPDHSLLITFDDGHAGNIRLLPILKEFRVPAVIYATSGLIGTRRHFWWKELRRWNLGRYSPELKSLPFPDFCRRLKELCDFEFEREYDDPDALDIEQLRRLRDAGCEIASHTVNHPILTHCSDEGVLYECRDSKQTLENLLQCEVRHFALPNGDYHQRILDQIEQIGYLSNRTIDAGFNTEKTPLMKLRNFGLSDNGSRCLALLKVSGFWSKIKK